MSLEEYLIAKRANDRVGLFLVGLTVVWLPIYLWGVRPIINSWLAHYIESYPAMLHLIPIFLPLVIGALLLGKKYPPPKPPSQSGGNSP